MFAIVETQQPYDFQTNTQGSAVTIGCGYHRKGSIVLFKTEELAVLYCTKSLKDEGREGLTYVVVPLREELALKSCLENGEGAVLFSSAEDIFHMNFKRLL